MGVSGSGSSQALLLGSEFAALRAYLVFNNAIDRAALAQLLRFGQVPAPLSIHSGIAKLPAGHWLSIPLPHAPGALLPSSPPGPRQHRSAAARLRQVRSSDDLYRSLVSEWGDPAALRGARERLAPGAGLEPIDLADPQRRQPPPDHPLGSHR